MDIGQICDDSADCVKGPEWLSGYMDEYKCRLLAAVHRVQVQVLYQVESMNLMNQSMICSECVK